MKSRVNTKSIVLISVGLIYGGVMDFRVRHIHLGANNLGELIYSPPAIRDRLASKV